MNYKGTILGDAPVAYWRLNDSSSTASDISGNANPGTAQGAGVTTGQPSALPYDSTSSSMAFDGAATSYISIPTATVLHPGDTFSLESWYKSANSNGNGRSSKPARPTTKCESAPSASSNFGRVSRR